MEFPAATVAVFEDNKTRAELYALWLEEYDVRVASSKRAAQEQIDDEIGVAVVSEVFADGVAETLVEIVRTESPLCRVLAVEPRTEASVHLDAARRLAKPVFEETLRESVETLLQRLNYQLALQLYYKTRMDLAAHTGASPTDDPPTEEAERLQERASTLQSRLEQYREHLSEEDIAAVMHDLTLDADESKEKQEVDSKYWPDACPNCGEQWETDEETNTLTRIASYVWRCTRCGNVIMENDPGQGRTHIYRG
jgi:predicted RNA-binding Zn-ribbon protein involved in translation (DUF1610 family)